MRIVIVALTGGSGFIGRMLAARHVARGDEVRILSRRPRSAHEVDSTIRIYHGDLSSSSDGLIPFVDGVDVLYHCAGEIRDESRMHAVHVTGTTNLIVASRGRIGRCVHLSSTGVFGPPTRGVITEETPFRPRGTYEVTKAESEKLVAGEPADGGFPWVIVRPTTVFGRGMPNGSLYQMIQFIDRGLFVFVGPPGANAPYVPVESVTSAMMLAGGHPRAVGRSYNVSDDRPLEGFVTAICAALGREVPRRRIPVWALMPVAWVAGKIPGSPLKPSRVAAMTIRAWYSTRRIEEELGYRPDLSVEQALAQLVDEWRTRRALTQSHRPAAQQS